MLKPDATPFAGCDGPFILFLQRAGQNNVGVARRFGQEEIDASVEFQLLERGACSVRVRNRHEGIKTDREQAANLAGFNGVKNLAGREPGPRNLGFGDAPKLRNEVPVVLVFDVAAAGQLVAPLAVLAAALAVPLPGDGSVSAAGLSDASAGQDKIDVGEAVFDALGVVLDSAGMQQHRCFRQSPDFRRADDACGGDARDRLGMLRRVTLHELAHQVEVQRVFRDKTLIDPAALDHHVENPIGKRAVASGFHRQKEIGRARNRRHARIDNDDLSAVVPRAPDVVGQDGKAFTDVRTTDHHRFSQRDVAPRIRSSIDAKRHLVCRSGADHAETPVVIHVGRAYGDPCKFADQVGLFIGHRGAAQDGERIAPVSGLDSSNRVDCAVQRLAP